MVTETFCSKAELRQLAEIACELIDMRPTDFPPEVFAKHALRNAKQEFANLLHISTVRACWSLFWSKRTRLNLIMSVRRATSTDRRLTDMMV